MLIVILTSSSLTRFCRAATFDSREKSPQSWLSGKNGLLRIVTLVVEPFVSDMQIERC